MPRKPIRPSFTEAEARAVVSAIGHALTPGCEWSDLEEGVGDARQNAAAERAKAKIQAALKESTR